MKVHNGRNSINSSAPKIILTMYTSHINESGKAMIWLCMSGTHSFSHTYGVQWVLIWQQNKTLKGKRKDM